jgi:hypothetical protein
MKRSLEAMQASSTSSTTRRMVTFAESSEVHVVDCTDTTKSLFYNKRDFSRFQSDFLQDETEAGDLTELRRKKRRQKDYQHDTITEIRRRRIENRILEIMQQGQQTSADDNNDICFQQRCVPLNRVPMRPNPPHRSHNAHAA